MIPSASSRILGCIKQDIEIAKAASEFSQLRIELLLNLTCLRNSEIARRNKLAEVTS
jgi:hypothetical protein